MKILILGFSDVGTNEISKLLADKMGYKHFYIVDEIKKIYGTVDNFNNKYQWPHSNSTEKTEIVKKIIKNNDNFVMGIESIFYKRMINSLTNKDVISVWLKDSVESVFERITFYDEFDKLLPDCKEYALKHKKYYMKEIKSSIKFYEKIYSEIPVFNINNRKFENIIEELEFKIIGLKMDKIIQKEMKDYYEINEI